jgi:hypothetical protein
LTAKARKAAGRKVVGAGAARIAATKTLGGRRVIVIAFLIMVWLQEFYLNRK